MTCVQCVEMPDTTALSAIHRDCFMPGWSEEAMAQLFAIPGTLAFVASGNAGFGILRIVGGEAEVITMAVLCRRRRQGIANAVADAMLHFAKACGVKTVFLEVRKGNEAAAALYRKFGFTQMSERKDYYHNSDGTTEDAVVMKKTL